MHEIRMKELLPDEEIELTLDMFNDAIERIKMKNARKQAQLS